MPSKYKTRLFHPLAYSYTVATASRLSHAMRPCHTDTVASTNQCDVCRVRISIIVSWYVVVVRCPTYGKRATADTPGRKASPATVKYRTGTVTSKRLSVINRGRGPVARLDF